MSQPNISKEDVAEFLVIALWKEDGVWMIDASCSCDQQINCVHSAATLIHLARGERLTKAFGDVVGDTPKKALAVEEKPQDTKVAQQVQLPDQKPDVSFVLRIERRPDGERLAYLPD